jgi:membrane protease YdiL (CAAX protease family)
MTFAFSGIFWFLIIRAGHIGAGGGLYMVGLMWCPGIAALLTTLIYQHDLRGLGWRMCRGRYVVLGYALPLAYAAITYFLVWFLGLGAFTTNNMPPGRPLLPFIIFEVTLGFLLSLLLALGEEIGWRGLLVPELNKITTFTNTALISGVIWAVWHFPLMLFSEYSSGPPIWYALVCFSMLIIGMSFVLAWLRIRSCSLWPAAVMHASHNLFIQTIFDRLTKDTALTQYITGEFGIALALAGIVMGYIFWRNPPNNPHFPSQH